MASQRTALDAKPLGPRNINPDEQHTIETEYGQRVLREKRVTAFISKKEFDSKYYNIKSGKVLILNNSKDFRVPDTPLADRDGSDVDASTICQRFAALPGFDDYDLETDLTKAETFQCFDRVKRSLNDKPVDCFILVLLSHGFDGGIYAIDQPMMFDEIVSTFNATNCPQLRFKPKVIITQACRGLNLSSGVDIAIDPNQPDAVADYTEYVEYLGLQTVRLPNEADFLFAFATVPGAGAFRHGEKGSPFIRHLCEALDKMEINEDFYSVLTTVNKTVGLTYQPQNQQMELNRVVQMPCFVSHLTKILRLKQN